MEPATGQIIESFANEKEFCDDEAIWLSNDWGKNYQSVVKKEQELDIKPIGGINNDSTRFFQFQEDITKSRSMAESNNELWDSMRE